MWKQHLTCRNKHNESKIIIHNLLYWMISIYSRSSALTALMNWGHVINTQMWIKYICSNSFSPLSLCCANNRIQNTNHPFTHPSISILDWGSVRVPVYRGVGWGGGEGRVGGVGWGWGWVGWGWGGGWGLGGSMYVKHRFSLHPCLVDQRKIGHTCWHQSSHIHAMSSEAFLSF